MQSTVKAKGKPRHNPKVDKAGQTLTQREVEVLWLIADGHSNKIIADRLGISEHTAKFHVFNAISKMGTACRTKAAVDFVLWMGRTAVLRLAPASSKSEYAKYRLELLDAFEAQDRAGDTLG